jgi:ABC-type uncharacterized transport system permease subunit
VTADAKRVPKTTASWLSSVPEMAIPILAVLTALAIGAIVIWASGANVIKAYTGLLQGAFLGVSNFTETLVIATPYTLAGLAVALGFRCGLFNIGVEGQFNMGALFSVYVGVTVKGLPIYIHLPLALLAGALGGALWGAIPGFLKAKLGVHEVTNTIMLNYIAVKTMDFLVKNPLRDKASSIPRTPFIAKSATLPALFASHRVHAGLLIAIVAIFVVYWLLWKTTLGFEIRTVGANPDAAKYAGMSVTRNFVLAMVLSGALAGLAGAGEVLGTNHNLPASFISGYGFDSIAIALLAKSHPFGILPAAFLWAALRNGAGLMQVRAGISIDLINIVQALVIVFIAADEIIRRLYRIKKPKEEIREMVFTRGWGR